MSEYVPVTERQHWPTAETEMHRLLNECAMLAKENARLKGLLFRTGNGCARLAKESARLRDDAERYWWLREQHWDDSVLCVTTHPKQNLILGAYCPSEKLLDAAIDAAIKDTK